jgi:diguanylate cyclase (GGDEF)-like protein/PAS domain S-box-containing protein
MSVRWADTAPAELRGASVVDLREGWDAVVVLDGGGRFVGVDERAEHILGTVDGAVLGRSRDELGLRLTTDEGEVLDASDDPIQVALASGEPVLDRVVGVELASPDGLGTFSWLSMTAIPVRGAEGTVTGVVTSLRDVSDTPEGRAATSALVRTLRSMSKAAAADEARFRALAENSADVVFQTDIVGRCVWVSPSVQEVLGWSVEELTGTSLAPLQHPDDRELANEQRRAHLASGEGGGHERLELRYATKTGGWRWMSVLSRPMRDPTGRVIGALSALRDIQDDVQSREELRYQAGHDSLTGLVNRDAAMHALGKALDKVRGTDRWVGLLYIDVDHFKDVNDTFGHEAGDRLLVQVAQRLTATLRESDVVARLGGDEFVVVLASIKATRHAMQRAESLLAAIGAPPDDGVPAASVSIGVVSDAGGADPALMMRAADAALYRAKQAGRNQVSI